MASAAVMSSTFYISIYRVCLYIYVCWPRRSVADTKTVR